MIPVIIPTTELVVFPSRNGGVIPRPWRRFSNGWNRTTDGVENIRALFVPEPPSRRWRTPPSGENLIRSQFPLRQGFVGQAWGKFCPRGEVSPQVTKGVFWSPRFSNGWNCNFPTRPIRLRQRLRRDFAATRSPPPRAGNFCTVLNGASLKIWN